MLKGEGPKRIKMICSSCGVEMNYHADKLDYNAALTEPNKIDPELGGILDEVHTCPKCGRTDVRKTD
jgi:ribosomal protein S27AE